jgi:predicted peptidase
MVKFARITAVLLIVCSFSCKHDQLYGTTPELLAPDVAAHNEEVNPNVPGYYSGVPVQYSRNQNKLYPLIVCFHGAGGFGNGGDELENVMSGVAGLLNMNQFPPSFKIGDSSYSFLTLAPQFRVYPTNEDIESFLEFARAKYRVDLSRVYLVGLSVGGRMASDYAAAHPDELAAVVTMGGCSDTDSIMTLDQKCKRIADANVPIWLFHNEDDEAWPAAGSRNFYTTISRLMPKRPSILTIFTEPEGSQNHDCWTRASDPKFRQGSKNIYEWMLGFKK